MLHKLGTGLLLADWLFRCHHKANTFEKILEINITINPKELSTDIPDYIRKEEIGIALINDEDPSMLSDLQIVWLVINVYKHTGHWEMKLW